MVKVLKSKSRFLFAIESLMCLVVVLLCMFTRHALMDAPHDSPDFLMDLELVAKGLLYTLILCLSLFLNDIYQVQILATRRRLLPRLAKSAVVALVIYGLSSALIPEQTQGRLVFAGSLVLTMVSVILLHASLRSVLNGRMFLEQVLVVGDGPLSATLRQELLAADYHQHLIQDARLENALLETIARIGRGDADAMQHLENLGDHVDLVVLALNETLWPGETTTRSLFGNSGVGTAGSPRTSADQPPLGATASSRVAPRTGKALGHPLEKFSPEVRAVHLPHAGPTGNSEEDIGVPVGEVGLAEAASSTAEAPDRDNLPHALPSRVVRLDAHRLRHAQPRQGRGDKMKAKTARPPLDHEALLRGLVGLKLSGLPVIRGLDYYEQLTGRVYLGGPEDSLFFTRTPFQINKVSFLIKGLWEKLLAFVIFVCAIPALLLVPVAIWLEDRKSPLFVQQRVGRFGQVYNLYKWRSMDDQGNITRVGRIIRKTKLDELPQLINVLRGEMSLVGPRPEMPHFVQQFDAQNPYYVLRHMVRPGLTGWAQLMFPDARAEDAMVKLSLDLYYVKNFSLISDMVIMAETLKMILFGGMARAMRSSPRLEAPLLELVAGGASRSLDVPHGQGG